MTGPKKNSGTINLKLHQDVPGIQLNWIKIEFVDGLNHWTL